MSTQPRVLYVGVNYRYINPTNSLLPAVLQRFSELDFYGPGFVGAETLGAGVERYADRAGGYDLVFAASNIFTFHPVERINRFLHRYGVLFSGGEITEAFLADARAFCRRRRERVICAITDLDPHAAQQPLLERIEAEAGYYMGWGREFVDALADAEAVRNEGYLQKKLQEGVALGLFDQFVRRQQSRVINLGHVVAETEFYWSALETRPYDAIVPGSRYARREKVLRALARSGTIRVAPTRYRYAFQVAERLGLRPHARFHLASAYGLAFQRAMSRSRSCVTDGGGNNFPVRKFLEIPASGALMICWPAVGLDRLGLRDGEHCVYVRTEEEAVDAVRAVSRDPLRFHAVAAAGREVVFRQHTVGARAAQLGLAVSRIQAGTFNGSSWKNGEFCCVTDSRLAAHA